MSERKKSKLGCILGCLGLSLVGAGALLVMFAGVGAAGLLWFSMGHGAEVTAGPSLAPVLVEVPLEPAVADAGDEVGDEVEAEDGDGDEDEDEDETETETVTEDDAVAEAEPVVTRPTSTTTRSSTPRASTTRASTTGSSATRSRPATPATSSTSTSSGTSSAATTTAGTAASSGTSDDGNDYDFPDPEPERPSTKVDYPPINERRTGNRSASWNVRTEGAITDVRLAVETGTGTYKVPSLVPEDRYVIEANFGDGAYVDAGKINVKEGEQYFIQCKATRKKCSVR